MRLSCARDSTCHYGGGIDRRVTEKVRETGKHVVMMELEAPTKRFCLWKGRETREGLGDSGAKECYPLHLTAACLRFPKLAGDGNSSYSSKNFFRLHK